MHHFTAHRLHFITEVQDTIELNEHQGSAIRGALFHALRRKFCAFARDQKAQCVSPQGTPCALVNTCPVATLVSTLKPGHTRGQDRPRPFTIQPPIAHNAHATQFMGHLRVRDDGRCFYRYEPGETLAFGLTLYAEAMALFPYIVLAMQAFETGGIGRKCEQFDGHWRRGALIVREVWADNPLLGERQAVIQTGSQHVLVPDIPITHAQILENTEWRMENSERRTENEEVSSLSSLLSLNFHTPIRLIHQGQLLKPHTFHFRPLFQRLLERLEALSEAFCDTPLHVDFPQLLALADAVEVVDQRLRWEEVRSYSTRRRRDSPTSGLVGQVQLQATDWRPFLPWLYWGQFVHVGKDAVKGNGMYKLA